MFFTWFSHQKEGIAEKVYYTQCRLGNYAAIHVTWPLVNLKLKIRITRNGVVPAQNFAFYHFSSVSETMAGQSNWTHGFCCCFLGQWSAFEQGTVSHGINSCDKWFFPEVITLRYPCANLCASNENQSSIYRQPPICKKQLWNSNEQIHSDQNNVIRYGNSVGLVWEKVFVSVFRVKLTTRACCCDKVLWQFKSNPIAVLS